MLDLTSSVSACPPMSPDVPAQKSLRGQPAAWNELIVFDRLTEAMGVLNQVPMPTRPRGYANSMPRYVHSAADIQGQREFFDLKQYARVAAIEAADRDRNRTRLLPSATEVGRAEEALAWPMQFLMDKPEVARAVCLGALWRQRGTSVAEGCRKLKLARRSFYRRQNFGLRLIAIALTRAQVPPA